MQGVLKVQCFSIEIFIDIASSKKRLGIRRKAETITEHRKIKRFNTKTVTCSKKLLLIRIPNRKGKHAM